jgi:hypothetical protein
MDAADDAGKAVRPERAMAAATEATTAASKPVSDHRFGPDAAAILTTEHWSLLGTRSLLWTESMSRTTIFLSVLSAAIVALALLANATGFGPQTTTLALVLLPVVLFWASPPTAGCWRSTRQRSSWWRRFMASTPTVFGTVDAALAAAIVVLAARAAQAATALVVAAGTVAFLVVWTALFLLERHTLDPLRRTTPRFPTPPTKPESTADGR